ncbi:transposase domain-containing protein [Streptomyces sp. NBC_01754]|uniref:transposase domain-containing protein n=1 Tax=Streptomyces sp. NBC_01754 TaxID=2975930 RepID=UPI002DD89EBC|nr:transposase domain-containing protein [Streptomyces sp. NBC_01754]WSC92426.1 transposase domain-containing protein [Streptomyces sp. NBC_01754]
MKSRWPSACSLPEHLGDLTQTVPFEMVDAALAETGAVQQRPRKLPTPVVVCLLPAAALFEDCGYLAVWRKLTAALEAIPVAKVTGTALRDAGRVLVSAPCGPGSTCCAGRPRRSVPATPGTRGY